MKPTLPSLLMALSLLLLAVFLALWLRQAYRQELDAVKKESNVLFINTVRGLEGEYMEELYRREPNWHQTAGPPNDSLRIEVTSQTKMRLRHPMPDSGPGMVRIFGDQRELSLRDSQVNVFIKTELPLPDSGNRRFVGSLALIYALRAGQSLQHDSLFNLPAANALPDTLTTRLGTQILGAGLPLKFRILQDADQLPANETPGFRSDMYVDVSSGARYAAQFSPVGTFIWKKLVPEIGFALLLYGCVTLAFFTVHKNLQRERRLTGLKNDFINNVTHELKTPIATVAVAVEALRSFDAMQNPARAGEYLEIAKNELSRLSILVDKVLKMSRFEQAGAELKAEPVDLKTLIGEVLQSLRLQFEKTGARVDFEARGDNFVLVGDRLHLTSVVYNLLDNALKYGGEEPAIQVGLDQGDGVLRVEVRDRGIGIPDEYRDKIFDKFFRVPQGDVHDTRGHGLGLHYVASVVRQHLGTIRAERNAGGVGTCFTLTLPQ